MTNNHLKAEDRFSPRNFLRARRPERFSDSVRVGRPILDRSILEYHLDTLTNRNEEARFQEFARQLAQREVAPNLLPQTGPTGGGDSKVDSETYPVAEAITAGWFVGAGGSSGSERWAFAMSAKKDWRSKVRSDIAAVAGTERGYARAFFISSRFIKDKDRATEEESLKKQHGIDVRILDRSWILDRVFGGHQEQLAIDTLGLKVNVAEELQKGPLDIQRERDLEEVEGRIQAALQGQPSLSFVDDCLEAARLSRNLERPRTETDGRFIRAERASVDHGTIHQKVLAHYEHAWTAFWWHEDLAEFVRLYELVEGLALGTGNVTDAELLSNLWTLLTTAARRGDIADKDAKVQEHTKKLKGTLEPLAAENERPSVSLQARALLAMMDLTIAIPEAATEAIQKLRKIVEESEGLIGFPLLNLGEQISEISKFFVGNDEFSRLFESLVELTARRKGEVAGARMLLRLGAQQLDAKRPYEAIKTIGRALTSLYKEESREDMVRALRLCAAAFERAGLLWAARGMLLHAASIATNDWWKESEITTDQHRCSIALKWVELQLGRLPHLLAWHETSLAIKHALVQQGYSEDGLSKGEREFDTILGILLLRADLWQLKKLETLPDTLHGLRLDAAGFALEFALGNDDQFEAGDRIVTTADQNEVFSILANQSAGNELPSSPFLLDESKLTLQSVILGSRIDVTVDNLSPCLEVAESILAAAEALLATSVFKDIAPYVDTFLIRVKHSDFGEFPFTFERFEEHGIPGIEVRCSSFKTSGLPVDQQATLKSALTNVIVDFLTRGFFIRGESAVVSLLRDEKALDRAIQFTGSFGTITNTLGKGAKLSISDWLLLSPVRHELKRSEQWRPTERRSDSDDRGERTSAGVEFAGPDEIPPEPDLTGIKHSDIHFESLIRGPLWDKAKWAAIGYASAAGVPPWMVLAFENPAPAAEIITQLVKDLGNDDAQNRLRVTIVRGISRKHPHHYRVLIGSNMEGIRLTKKYGQFMARVHTMTPERSDNLDRFLASFELERKFLLGVGAIDRKAPQMPRPMRDGYILKSELSVRNAWEIGLNDPDVAGVSHDDDVVIPAERMADAPVLNLVKWKVERANDTDWPSLEEKEAKDLGRKSNSNTKRRVSRRQTEKASRKKNRKI